VLSGSFLLRLLAWSKPEWGFISTNLPVLLEKTPKFKRWAEATVAHPSVNYIWDETRTGNRTLARIKKTQAAAQK
jgi:glutathione S-transferase